MRRALTVSITLLLGFTAQGSLAAQVEQAAQVPSISVEEAMMKLQTLIDQPAPAGLSPSDLAGYQAQTEWLRGVRARLDNTSKGIVSPRDVATGQSSGKREAAAPMTQEVVAPRDVATGQSSGKRMHKPMTVIKEWGAFKQSVEEESVRFMGISNASKARHDIAMNAIRNLKG